MLVFLFSWIIIKVLRQTQIKISALNIYCKDCHTTLSVPSLFGHGALYRFFLVLRKLLLVSYCVVVWVLFGVFLCFCITSFGDCTCPQHQETAHYKVWNLPQATAQNAIQWLLMGDSHSWKSNHKGSLPRKVPTHFLFGREFIALNF